MMKCNHKPVVIREVCFVGPVAEPPYTDEFPPAHGNITQTEECTECGAERRVNVNNLHSEYGPWGPNREEREAQERESAKRQIEAHERRCRKAARDAGMQVVAVNSEESVNVSIKGAYPQSVTLDQIRKAAEQPDNGDGLVPAYTGLLLVAEAAIQRRCAEERQRRS